MVASAQGEDRSNFQAVTSWNGFDFGFVKATEGTTFTDSTFAANWANLKAAGIPRGAYHFFHPDENPAAQASFFLSVVNAHGLAAGDMLVIDSETAASNVDAATLAFLQAVKAAAPAGVILLTYTDLSLAAQMHQTAAQFPNLWIAWPSSTAPGSVGAFASWAFWQWGSPGGVDRDAFNGTTADLAAWIQAQKGNGPMANIPVWWTQILNVEHQANGDMIVTGIAGVNIPREVPTLFHTVYTAATDSWADPVEIGTVNLGG